MKPAGDASSSGPGTFPLVDWDIDDPIVKPIFDAMKAEGNGPLNIHRTIAHAPEIYRAYTALASALRHDGVTSRADRELCILRTTQLRSGEYEFFQHRRIGLTCGLTEEQVDNLEDWRAKPCYDERQRLILELTEQMVTTGVVDDHMLTEAKRVFSSRELVELAMTSAFYTALVQFSRALRIEPEIRVSNYGAA